MEMNLRMGIVLGNRHEDHGTMIYIVVVYGETDIHS